MANPYTVYMSYYNFIVESIYVYIFNINRYVVIVVEEVGEIGER